MGTFNSFEEALAFSKKDRFAAQNGMCLTAFEDGCCTCGMDIRPDHQNAFGGVMGGAVFSLAEFAFGVCANNDHLPSVALEMHIHFLSASKGSRLTARAVRVKSGRSTCVYEVRVTDNLGKDIALVTATGFKLSQE